MKYDFTKIKLTDVEGKEIKDSSLPKVMGNAIYTTTKDLGMVEKAQEIYKGNPVELDENQKEEVKNVVQQSFAAFAQKPILEYIESIKK